MNKPLLLVSAIALQDSEKRILLARRPEGRSLAGLWEFPGGKIEQGETPEEALVRECAEELGVKITPIDLTPITFASHSTTQFHLLMPLFLCTLWQGEPHGLENQQLAWVPLSDLANYPMPEADIPLVKALHLFLA